MSKIIKKRERVTVTTYEHVYTHVDNPGSGFFFPCDRMGIVDVDSLKPAGLENFRKCVEKEYNVVDRGVEERTHSYTEPAVLRCNCGRHVHLETNDNECRCGAIYNLFGQELAPRDQWEEEDNCDDYYNTYN